MDCNAGFIFRKDTRLQSPDNHFFHFRSINSFKSSEPIFFPLALAATYTLTSATPAYTHLLETGVSAAQPNTSLFSVAISLQVFT